MTQADPLLDRAAIEAAFRRLGERLARRGQASVYVARGGDSRAPRVFEHLGLRVSVASPEHLLAMKVLAARRRDVEDIRFLVERVGLTTVDALLSLCAEAFPEGAGASTRGSGRRTRCRR